MDTQTVIALINLGGLVFAIYQLIRQRKDTENLARLTSDLEHRVHRLATNLDQKIYQLTRVRDLITGLVHVSVTLRQKNRSHSDKLEMAVKREMTMPELAALVEAINDNQLKELYRQLDDILFNPIWPHLWNELDYDMGTVDQLLIQQNTCIRHMHKRVLELLEKTTRIDEKS